MRNIVTVSLLSFLCLFFAGCGSGWRTFKAGTYDGMKYELQSRSRSGLFSVTNTVDWRIRLGKLPAVPVDATVTDWGPPYSTDIYGADAYLYLPGSDTAYRNTPDTPGTMGVFHTMLYISPGVLSETEFETFYRFMEAEWPRMRNAVVGTEPRDVPDIIGLVYGSPDKYRQAFKGKHGGRSMVLRIEPDGRVRLIDDDKWANENYSGLSQKVQMPGKWLLLEEAVQNGGLTREELRGLRNKQGVAVDALFEVRPAAGESR